MTADTPLYERDPEAWNAYLAEGNARQARKRVSADVILRDRMGRLLLVDPRYKPDWDTPGGMAEANESPRDAARRELGEELGVDISPGRLLCVDWVSPHGPWDDLVAFIFDGGELTDEQISSFSIGDDEIIEFKFFARDEIVQQLRPYVWRRVTAALDALEGGAVSYLQDGVAFPA